MPVGRRRRLRFSGPGADAYASICCWTGRLSPRPAPLSAGSFTLGNRAECNRPAHGPRAGATPQLRP